LDAKTIAVIFLRVSLIHGTKEKERMGNENQIDLFVMDVTAAAHARV
jgi:hypothetical protein